MKTLLVSPPFGMALTAQDIDVDKNVNITGVPIGLLYIGSYLRQKGYECDIINAPTEKDYMKRFNDIVDNYDYIGFSVMTTQISGALKMAKIAKDKGKVVVFGGPHPTLFPEQTIEHPLVDIVVNKEGEQTMLEIVEGKELEDIKGIIFIKNDNLIKTDSRPFMNMDDLPLLDFSFLPQNVWKALEMLPAHSSRGCSHECTFCINRVTCNWWRSMSAEKFLEQIEHLVKHFGQNQLVNIQDECFFVKKERTKEILKGMKKYKFKWVSNVRANYFTNGLVDDEVLKLLREANCYMLDLGAESGSQRMLDFLKKGIKVEDILESNRKLTDHDVIGKYSFMTGLPTETKEDTDKTLILIRKLLDINPKTEFFGPRIYRPQYPGGELSDVCTKMGWKGPQSLDEWAEWNEKSWNLITPDQFPWIDKSRVSYLEMLEPVVRFANQPVSKTVNASINAPKVLKYLYAYVAKARWKLNYFGFPIEYKMAMWMIKRNNQKVEI